MKKKLLILFIIIIILTSLCIVIFFKENNGANCVTSLVGENISSIKKYTNTNFEVIYEYNDSYEKDVIISEKSLNDSTISLVVSKGKLDLEKMKKDNINELGRVPIMMYHGIVNTTDNKYIGGNVDKDGYNRTTSAFINDLEMYYQKGYRMIRLNDYINGDIDVLYGKSPIILTFDDGNENNIKVLGLDSNGNIIIDENSAVGVLESFKKKYPDFNVTATFFVNGSLFNQPEYNEKIIKWLINNGYDIGNHTYNHINIGTSSSTIVVENIAKVYSTLDNIIPNKYVHIVALPFGSPYNKSNENFLLVFQGLYNDYTYQSISSLRVGWEPELSPYDIGFDKTYLKRCRAYDNNGGEYDIQMVFASLDSTRFISDGDNDIIVTKRDNESLLNNTNKKIYYY